MEQIKIDKEDFRSMNDEIKSKDDYRDQLIKRSRDIIILSKKIIYGLHRGEEVAEDVKTITQKKNELDGIANTSSELPFQGAYKEAIQEYVEALAYYYYVKDHKLANKKELGVSTEHYLLGLCDLPGEINRKVIGDAIHGKYKSAPEALEFIETIWGILLGFDFRNGELRKKFDQVKYELKKLQDTVFELKIKGKLE